MKYKLISQRNPNTFEAELNNAVAEGYTIIQDSFTIRRLSVDVALYTIMLWKGITMPWKEGLPAK